MTATADIQRSNGEATAEPTFPLDSFRDAAAHLRRPFTPAAVKFKVQAVWPKDAPTGGLIVAYIDARLAVERLNLILPHLWHDEYQQIDGRLLLCRLTVDGITRQDVGEGQGKGLFSDALKRAAVKFGVGVSLYAVPKMTLNAGEHAKQKRSNQGPTLEITPAGERRIRTLYAAWLDSHGVTAFGKPLDHGDVEGAQGDTEADDPPAAPAAPEAASVELVTPEDILALQAASKGLTVAQIKLSFGAAGLSAPDPFVIERAFDGVPKAKALELAKALGGGTA